MIIVYNSDNITDTPLDVIIILSHSARLRRVKKNLKLYQHAHKFRIILKFKYYPVERIAYVEFFNFRFQERVMFDDVQLEILTE